MLCRKLGIANSKAWLMEMFKVFWETWSSVNMARKLRFLLVPM